MVYLFNFLFFLVFQKYYNIFRFMKIQHIVFLIFIFDWGAAGQFKFLILIFKKTIDIMYHI